MENVLTAAAHVFGEALKDVHAALIANRNAMSEALQR